MRALFALCAAGALVACGGSTPAPTAAPATRAAPSAPPAAPSAEVAPDRGFHRTTVKAVVSQGLGAFLAHVDLADQPVFVGGKFHGFRIAGLRDAQFWNGVDLRPGDVVTSVNGFPIERPEQAQRALESLEVASELRVAYERDGQPRELVFAIVDP